MLCKYHFLTLEKGSWSLSSHSKQFEKDATAQYILDTLKPQYVLEKPSLKDCLFLMFSIDMERLVSSYEKLGLLIMDNTPKDTDNKNCTINLILTNCFIKSIIEVYWVLEHIAKRQKLLQQIPKKAIKSPQEFLKEYGVDITNRGDCPIFDMKNIVCILRNNQKQEIYDFLKLMKKLNSTVDLMSNNSGSFRAGLITDIIKFALSIDPDLQGKFYLTGNYDLVFDYSNDIRASAKAHNIYVPPYKHENRVMDTAIMNKNNQSVLIITQDVNHIYKSYGSIAKNFDQIYCALKKYSSEPQYGIVANLQYWTFTKVKMENEKAKFSYSKDLQCCNMEITRGLDFIHDNFVQIIRFILHVLVWSLA